MNFQKTSLDQFLQKGEANYLKCEKDSSSQIHSLDKRKYEFEKKLSDILIDSNINPQNKATNSAFWIGDYIAANPKILTKTLNLKINSVYCDLRNHQFQKIGKLPKEYANDLPDIKRWSIFSHATDSFKQRYVLQGKDKLLKWKQSPKPSKNIINKPNEIQDDESSNKCKLVQINNDNQIQKTYKDDILFINNLFNNECNSNDEPEYFEIFQF